MVGCLSVLFPEPDLKNNVKYEDIFNSYLIN
jgi:hypothetical protein